MTQVEFLEVFSQSLVGNVSEDRIQENVDYYRRYINEQITSGKSEGEVLENLGNPRLLAKTIIEKDKFTFGERDNIFSSSDYQKDSSDKTAQFTINNKVVKLPSWLIGIIAVLIVALVIGVVFSLLSVLAPVIIGVVLVAMVIRIIRNIIDN